MPYLLIFSKYAARLIKKLAPNIKTLIVKELELIAKNPHLAPQLKGKFSFLRSRHIYLRGVPYQIIFEIEDGTKRIVVHLCGEKSGCL